jgi:phosphoglycerate dehydrogenase-like enzyme
MGGKGRGDARQVRARSTAPTPSAAAARPRALRPTPQWYAGDRACPAGAACSNGAVSQTRFAVAGTAFAAIREHLEAILPGVPVDMVPVPRLRRGGHAAEVLIPAMSRIDGELMDAVEGLRLIHQWGAGLDGVDLAAATRRGILVANVPAGGGGNAESVAEWCVMAAIAVNRRLPVLQEVTRSGSTWGGPIGRALLGRTAGIVGLGGIGQALAPRLRPFGMRLLGVRRRPDPELATRLGLDWLGGVDDLPELLRQSDCLFLCLPLTEATRGLVDAHALSLLPDGACVVNAGRGGVVDQAALLDALDRGRLTGAALDVFDQEPLPAGSALAGRADVVATPHIAGVTDVSYRGIAERVVDNVRRLEQGRSLLDCVNAGPVAAQASRES